MTGKDCCPGEDMWGWPGALHTEDCPTYLRWADAHVAQTRARFEAERRQPQPSAIDLAYRAGYAAGLRAAAEGEAPDRGRGRKVPTPHTGLVQHLPSVYAPNESMA